MMTQGNTNQSFLLRTGLEFDWNGKQHGVSLVCACYCSFGNQFILLFYLRPQKLYTEPKTLSKTFLAGCPRNEVRFHLWVKL